MTGSNDTTTGDERTHDDSADDQRVLQEEALDSLRVALVQAVTRLEEAGARDEALAELVEARRVMLVKRDAVLRQTRRAWRLGALMLGRDGTLYATGSLVRAREFGVRNHQSQSAEERRDLRAAALRGKFAPGETVNHGWRELALDVDAVRSGDGPLLFRPDGTLGVRWNAALGDASVREVTAYLDERVALLVAPPDIP